MSMTLIIQALAGEDMTMGLDNSCGGRTVKRTKKSKLTHREDDPPGIEQTNVIQFKESLVSSLAKEEEEAPSRKSSKRRVIRRRKVKTGKVASIIDDRGSDLSCLVDYEDPPEEPSKA